MAICLSIYLELIDSESGIRTHGPVTVSGFQDQCNRPTLPKRSMNDHCPICTYIVVGVVGVEPTCVSRRVTVSSLTIREHTQKEYQHNLEEFVDTQKTTAIVFVHLFLITKNTVRRV